MASTTPECDGDVDDLDVPVISEGKEHSKDPYDVVAELSALKQQLAQEIQERKDAEMVLRAEFAAEIDRVSQPGVTAISTSARRLEIPGARASETGASVERSPASGRSGLGVIVTPTQKSVAAESVDTADMVQFLQGHHFHTHGESIWDAALFLGVHMPMLETLFGWLLLVGNVFLQLTFAQIVTTIATQEQASDGFLEGLLFWRLGIGHDVRTYDELTQTSLVTRVCGKYVGRTQSELHAATLQSYQDFGLDFEYIGARLGNLEIGSALMELVLLVWLMTVIVEITSIIRFASSLISLPRAQATRLSQTRANTLRMDGISITRLVVMLFAVVLPRLVVAFALLFAGCEFLLATTTLQDLVLNAVALGFIFDLDELFFGLLPARCQAMVKFSEQLSIKSFSPFKQFRPCAFLRQHDIKEMVLMAAMFCFLFGYLYGEVRDVADAANEGKEILCGGYQNFVFTTNAATGLVVYSNDTRGSEVFDLQTLIRDVDGRLQLTPSAVLQLTGLSPDLSTIASVAGASSAFGSVKLAAYASIKGVVDLSLQTQSSAEQALLCWDSDLTEPEQHALYEKISTWSGWNSSGFLPSPDMAWRATCADVVMNNFCDTREAKVVCPISCRCTDQLYGSLNSDGCPINCISERTFQMQEFMQTTSRINHPSCVDTLPPPLLDNPEVNPEWVTRFVRDIGRDLETLGWITVAGDMWIPTPMFNASVGGRTQGYYVLSDISQSSLNPHSTAALQQEPCVFLEYLRVLFGVDLCDWQVRVDNLARLCPVRCGVCAATTAPYLAGDNLTEVGPGQFSWKDVYLMQEIHLGTRILTIPGPVTYNMVCGQDLVVDTSDFGDFGQQPGNDILITFEAPAMRYIVIDMCTPNTKVPGTIFPFEGNWSRGRNMSEAFGTIANVKEDHCNSLFGGFPGTSIAMEDLQPGGIYSAWIDNENLGGGEIEISLRCSHRPLYWEVLQGACEVVDDNDLNDQVAIWTGLSPSACVQSPRYPEAYPDAGGCFIRVFPASFLLDGGVSRVYSPSYFWAQRGDWFKFQGAEELRQQENFFEWAGQSPAALGHIEWAPDVTPMEQEDRDRAKFRWRVCARPPYYDPWRVLYGPCRRYYQQLSYNPPIHQDCIETNIGGYSNLETCGFHVPVPWEALGLAVGIQIFQTEANYDKLILDYQGPNQTAYSGVYNGPGTLNGDPPLQCQQLDAMSMLWQTDQTQTAYGFKICAENATHGPTMAFCPTWWGHQLR